MKDNPCDLKWNYFLYQRFCLSVTQKAALLMNYLCLSLLRSITWFQLWLTWPTRVFSDDFILDVRWWDEAHSFYRTWFQLMCRTAVSVNVFYFTFLFNCIGLGWWLSRIRNEVYFCKFSPRSKDLVSAPPEVSPRTNPALQAQGVGNGFAVPWVGESQMRKWLILTLASCCYSF